MNLKINGYGFQVDLNHFNNAAIENLVSKLVTLKASWVRIEIDRKKYSKKSNLNYLSKFCHLCTIHDIIIVGLLCDFIPGTISNMFFPHLKYTPVIDDIDTYKKFLHEILSILSGYIYYWEVWNEQNSKRFWVNDPNPKEYVTFLKIISDQIRSTQKNAQIIFGGINGNDIKAMLPMSKKYFQYTKFFQECLDFKAAKYVDHIAIHPYILSSYFSFDNKETIVKKFKYRIDEFYKKYRNYSIIITEIGVSSTLNLRIQPKSVAFIYHEIINYCSSISIPVCFYILADQDPNHYIPLNPERNFGLLDYQLNPKPLFNEFLKLL